MLIRIGRSCCCVISIRLVRTRADVLAKCPTVFRTTFCRMFLRLRQASWHICMCLATIIRTPDGTGVRDYIHVVDLARGHVAAADFAMKHTGTEIINLGTGHGYSVLDIVKAFEKVNGVKVPYKIEARRPGDIAECWADPTKAKELLGWSATKNLEDMCRDAWRWQTQNPNGYDD